VRFIDIALTRLSAGYAETHSDNLQAVTTSKWVRYGQRMEHAAGLSLR
jgi:hypothetical protein